MFLGPWCTINPAHTQLSVKHLKWATSVSLSTLKASGRLGECCSFHVIWKNQEFSAVLWTSVNLTDKPNKIGALCLWDTSSSPPERFSIGHCEEAQSSCYVISTHPFTWVLWEDREHWRCQCAEQYCECRSHQSQPYHSTASHSYYKFITILRTSRTYWRTWIHPLLYSQLKLSQLVMMTPLLKVKNTGLTMVGLCWAERTSNKLQGTIWPTC